MSFLKLVSILISLILTSHLQPYCDGARIFFFVGYASHSHLVSFEPLANKLADDPRHQVLIMSPVDSEKKHPNITYFCPDGLLQLQKALLQSMGPVLVNRRIQDPYKDFYMEGSEAWEGMIGICRGFYQSPQFQKFIEDSNRFDLIITDASHRECVIPIAHKWNAKFIASNPTTMIPGELESFGCPTDASIAFPFYKATTMPEMISNEFVNLKWYFWRQFKYYPAYDEIIKRDLKLKDIPPISDLLSNTTSLYFSNTHLSTDVARSLPPFVVPVGGMHVQEKRGISDPKIRKFVEESDGFIYISWGSVFPLSGLPLEKLQVFVGMMQNFPKLKFLVKWDGQPIKDLPKNVLTAKWFKQQELLAHSKCLGFISQGGTMSYQQAIYHGIPMIINAIVVDQTYNARNVEKFGNGIAVEIGEMTVETLTSAVDQLINNKTYKKNAKERSVLFKDRPMSAVDLAVWWTEYVLRHDQKTLNNLKSPTIHQFWWQKRLLHLWAIVYSLLFIIFIILTITIVFIVKSCFSFKSKKKHNNNGHKKQSKEKKGQ